MACKKNREMKKRRTKREGREEGDCCISAQHSVCVILVRVNERIFYCLLVQYGLLFRSD